MTNELVDTVRAAFAQCPLPVKVQNNIPRRPNTGGPGWFSIDLVVPILEGAGGILLAAGVMLGTRTLIHRIRGTFPGALVRILSDRKPTIAYQAPANEELDAAIDAIASDYLAETSTSFAIKRWTDKGAWEIDLARVRRTTRSVSEVNKRQTSSDSNRTSEKRRKLASFARDEIRRRVDSIVRSVQRPVTHHAAALSELDAAIAQLNAMGPEARSRADAACVGEALELILTIRQRRGSELVRQWAQETGIHQGIDLATPLGSRITAIHAAQVIEVGIDGYGDHAVRLRERTVDVILGHLSRAVVRPGQRVRRGQLVGYSGEEGGISTGRHIHVEIRPIGGEFGTAIDPMPYLQSAEKPRPKMKRPQRRTKVN